MSCAETELLLHALLNGELDVGHARDVETHLQGCPRCAARFAPIARCGRPCRPRSCAMRRR